MNEINTDVRERTLRLSLREGVASSFMWGFGDAYVIPFAIFLSGGPTVVALLGTLPPLLGAIGQIFGAELTNRVGHRKRLILVMTTLQAVSFIPLFILPFFLPSAGGMMVLAIYSLTSLLCSGNIPLWISLMGDVVPEATRGRYFGLRARVSTAAMIGSMLIAGFLMTQFKRGDLEWVGYGLVFLIASVARFLSTSLLRLHVDLPRQPVAAPPLGERASWIRLSRSPYASFLVVNTLLGGASALAGPFFGLYMLRDLGWTYAQFTVMTVAFLGAHVVISPWWGRLCDRHGNRAVFHATCLLIPSVFIMWFLTNHFAILLGVQILSGALFAGCGLAASNYFFDTVPPAHRDRVMAYQSLLSALTNLVAGGVLGSFLARNIPSEIHLAGLEAKLPSVLPVIFLLSGIARFLLGLLLLPRVREVRPVEPVSSLSIIRRLALAEPLREQMGHLANRFSSSRR